MNREKLSSLSTRTGGFLGVVLFLVFGLKPAFVYGGMLGVATAAAMHGGPVGAELATRVIVAGGMLLGVLAVGFFMTVVGALFGTAVYELVLEPVADRTGDLPTPKAAAKKA